MGQFFESIPNNLIEWIKKQHIFYVATAPLATDGHVNVSPKGLQDSFHIIDGNKVWYEDLTGSGVETISHLRENGRITVMFTAFDGAPRIVRLFGYGTVHEFGTPEYDTLIPESSRKPGSRAAIVVDVYKVGSSCGYSVPYYDFKAPRTALLEYLKKSEDKSEMKNYWQDNNTRSLDGLPGIQSAIESPVALKSLDVQTIAKMNGGGRKPAVSVTAKRVDTANLKLIMAFTAGLLTAAVYVKLFEAA